MWLVESYGPVVEVEAFPGEGLHARCDPSYREKVLHLSGLGLEVRVRVRVRIRFGVSTLTLTLTVTRWWPRWRVTATASRS